MKINNQYKIAAIIIVSRSRFLLLAILMMVAIHSMAQKQKADPKFFIYLCFGQPDRTRKSKTDDHCYALWQGLSKDH